MELKAYSVRDLKGGAYTAPWFKTSHGEAEREFARVARDSQSVINQFPEDFELFYVGTFNVDTGRMTTIEIPQHIAKATDLKGSGPQQH